MAYNRYLVDSDYLALITQEGLNQLVRDIHDRIPAAEQSAEMNMLEYLDQYYELRVEFEKAKRIREYSPLITYPAGVFIKYNGHFVRVIKSIHGRVKPSAKTYWIKVEDVNMLGDLTQICRYSQLKTYNDGDYVLWDNEYWCCTENHGWDFQEIHVPGTSPWVMVDVYDWEAVIEYDVHDVVKYEGEFYTLINKDDSYDSTVSPDLSDYWGLIGEYSEDFEYDASVDAHDYVVREDCVFYPVMSPNADAVEENVNFVYDDMRNLSVVKHMTRLALYNLHKLISPTNISEVRRLDYEDTQVWLYKASKFQIDPMIPRRRNKYNGKPEPDWALATYQASWDPWENSWLF